MKDKILTVDSENTILISVEFLEDGYVLKSGRSHVHRYELDLLVRNDITCGQLLGAVYAGLRSVLTERYQLDVRENISQIVYHDRLTALEDRSADPQRGNLWLRPRAIRELRLRAATLRYAKIRRKIAQIDQRYPHKENDQLAATPEERERLGWLVCWQVFLECFHAYSKGYPGANGVANAQMLLSEEYRCHPVIARGTVNFQAQPNRLEYNDAVLPLLWLQQKEHGFLTLHELGFTNGSRLIFDPVLWHQSALLFDEREIEQYRLKTVPFYNLGSRPPLPQDPKPHTIDPPPAPPAQAPLALAPIVLPSVLTTGSVVAMWAASGFSPNPEQAVVMGSSMVAATALSTLLNRKLQTRSNEAAQKKWCEEYQGYIREQLDLIAKRQQQDVALMLKAYPPAFGNTDEDLVHRILRIEDGLYSRKPEDPNYLCARIGLSLRGSRTVKSHFPVEFSRNSGEYTGARYKNLFGGRFSPFTLELGGKGDRTDALAYPESGDLTRLPEAITDQYNYLEGAPVLVGLKENAALGLVAPMTTGFAPFLANFLLDLCFHHSPEELQIVMFCEETNDWKRQQDLIHRYKHLPHFRGLMKDRSAFAFNEKDAAVIFDRILMLALEREESHQRRPHILLICQHKYGFYASRLSQRIAEEAWSGETVYGFTCIFCGHTRQELPDFCTSVIHAGSEREWYLLPSQHQIRQGADIDPFSHRQFAFRPDPMPVGEVDPQRSRDLDLHCRAFKTLSAMYYQETDRSAVPAYLELFRMMTDPSNGFTVGEVADAADGQPDQVLSAMLDRQIRQLIFRNWSDNTNQSLAVAVGRNASGAVMLDLREEADGAHLLIAGDRRTGKTAAAVTYLLQLSSRFSPDRVQLLMVDLAGTGVSASLRRLPRATTFLADPAASREAIVDQFRSLLDSLHTQILQRRLQLARTGCDCIETYQQRYPNQTGANQMPHLFVVLEDYEKLCQILSGTAQDHKRITLDHELMRLIDSSSDLGIHLVILSRSAGPELSQKLLDRIPVRLCLRVSDPETSERLVYTRLAASGHMPEHGRAYLCCKGSSFTDHLQIGYSGADIVSRRYAPFLVTLARPTGENVPFFDSERYQPPSAEEEEVFYTTYGADYPPVSGGTRPHPNSPPQTSGPRTAGSGAAAAPAGGSQPGNRDARPKHAAQPAAARQPVWQSTAVTGDVRPNRAQQAAAEARPGQYNSAGTGDKRPNQAAQPAGDERPAWWYEQFNQQNAAGTGDERPNRGAQPAGDKRPNRGAQPAGDVRPNRGTQSAGDVRPNRGAQPAGDVRPAWWYEQQANQKKTGDQRPDKGVQPSGDERPEHVYRNPYEHTRKQKTEKTFDAGKRYRFRSIRTTSKQADRDQDRAKRYFRSPTARKNAKWTRLPRPDSALCGRKATGVTQAEFLSKLLRSCEQSRPTTSAVR